MTELTHWDLLLPLFAAMAEGTEEAAEEGLREHKRLAALKHLAENAEERWGAEPPDFEERFANLEPLSDEWHALLDNRGRYCVWPNKEYDYVKGFL